MRVPKRQLNRMRKRKNKAKMKLEIKVMLKKIQTTLQMMASRYSRKFSGKQMGHQLGTIRPASQARMRAQLRKKKPNRRRRHQRQAQEQARQWDQPHPKKMITTRKKSRKQRSSRPRETNISKVSKNQQQILPNIVCFGYQVLTLSFNLYRRQIRASPGSLFRGHFLQCPTFQEGDLLLKQVSGINPNRELRLGPVRRQGRYKARRDLRESILSQRICTFSA